MQQQIIHCLVEELYAAPVQITRFFGGCRYFKIVREIIAGSFL
jgi:hypothetical protein